ncbi:DinB family protein [Arthrobacter sp. MDT1-65]
MTIDLRPFPPAAADEAATLTGFLDYLRATVVLKARGLSDADGARRILPPPTTASGIVRHLARVERSWFHDDIDGDTDGPWARSRRDRAWEFGVTAEDSLDDILLDYAEACAESRQVLAGHGLDDPCLGTSKEHNVRWVLVHMIEETARHCGHLDVIRELLDGTTGQ